MLTAVTFSLATITEATLILPTLEATFAARKEKGRDDRPFVRSSVERRQLDASDTLYTPAKRAESKI